MSHYVGDTSAYQRYGNGTRSSGYDDPATINSHPNAGYETTNPSNHFNDKWAQWFGQPPYAHYQTDNYAMLGHENYQLPTACKFFPHVYTSCLFLTCFISTRIIDIGRNLHIEKMLNVSIASEDDYYTR